jgi:hypothetical protein
VHGSIGIEYAKAHLAQREQERERVWRRPRPLPPPHGQSRIRVSAARGLVRAANRIDRESARRAMNA